MPGWTPNSLLLSIAVKSMIVLAVASMAALSLRGRSAAARHVAWSAAFAALLALPLLSISLPALRVPVLGSFAGSRFVFQTNSSASAQGLASPAERLQTTHSSIQIRPLGACSAKLADASLGFRHRDQFCANAHRLGCAAASSTQGESDCCSRARVTAQAAGHRRRSTSTSNRARQYADNVRPISRGRFSARRH